VRVIIYKNGIYLSVDGDNAVRVIIENNIKIQTDYFVYLFLKFAEQQKRVLESPCCVKLFVPKSNRTEMYCDRILIDSKICKQIAPKRARKLKQRNDPLLEEYERAENKNYKRVGCY